MWGKRREVQAEKSSEAAPRSSDAPIAGGGPSESPLAASDLASAVIRHLEAISPPNSAASSADAKQIIDAKPALPVYRGSPPIIRANPVSTAFGDMVALLSRSPAHNNLSLADLEWRLLPPVALNQFALADSKLPNGKTVLAAFVLWARVAPEVHARLMQGQSYPIRLQHSEWQSGDCFCIVDAVGNFNVVRNIITELSKEVFGANFYWMRPSSGCEEDLPKI
jgi:hemolysin-activating ACP:hemolysin acyltransferase